MGLLIYGTYSKPIGIDEFFVKCAACEAHTWHDVMISSKYLHFYGIPACPVEKEADFVCQKCGLKRYGRSFNEDTIPDFRNVKRNFRHPVSSWFLTLLIATPLFISILINILT
jgi:hypothetical protein